MRTFETALILVNGIALLLTFRPWSKNVWFFAAWANLSVLALHGAIEGFRWQMAFAYLFTALFTVGACIKIRGGRFPVKISIAVRGASAALALICLGLTALL